jgi:hypothetical protein
MAVHVSQHGTLLDIPIELAAGADCWAANVWSDPTVPGRWLRQRWDRSLPGWHWRVPADLAIGTVVEFGAGEVGDGDARWYGWVADAQLTHIVLMPASGATDAEARGRAAVELWKQAQLDVTANTWRAVARATRVGE